MKSLKKTLVLLVVFSMILSTLVPAFAFDDVVGKDCEEQVTRMVALGILNGMDDGNFQPEGTITRAQMAKIICYMTGVDESLAETSKNVPSKFSDVEVGAWYTGYVNIASNNGIINGYPDGTFRPSQELTMNEVLTLCVKALGRGGYVEKTGGTWPANYIAEAARLNLLKDVENQAVANRGNVAIISWNTLNSKKWVVTGEEINGVNFGDMEEVKTLLAIHFPEFVDETKFELKEAEATVLNTPAKTIEIGERQVILSDIDTTNDNTIEFKSKSDYKKAVREERTYIDGNVVAYVPEEVCADLDALLGRKVTVVFGKDNVVASIVVEDEGVANEFVDEFDATEETITIAGDEYEFSNDEDVDVEIYVNGKEIEREVGAALTYIFETTLGEKEDKDLSKNVEAKVVLDEDGDIARLDLYLSGTYSAFNTIEGVVTKNSSETITYYYYNGTSWVKDTYDYEDELEDDKLPRVTINGEKGSIEEIEAGNVITMCYGKDKDEVKTVYVATEPVEGEVTKTKKDGNRIYVEDVEYTSSMSKILATDDEIKDAGKTTVTLGETIAKNDAVTLYVNVYGEYVIVVTDDASAGEWQFAYVRSIKEVDENDAEEYVATLRLLLANGEKVSNYSLVVSSEDFVGTDANKADIDEFEENVVAGYVNKVIAFKANSENEIVVDDKDDQKTYKVDFAKKIVTVTAGALGDAATTVVDDYKALAVAKTSGSGYLAVDDDRETIGNYDFNADTVIFDTKDEKVYTKWNSIISGGALVANTVLVLDKNDIKYMIFVDELDATSDEIFALYKNVNSDEITLFNGEDNVFEHTGATVEDAADEISENAFVEYAVNSANEVRAIASLIDVDAFRAEEGKSNILASSANTTLVKTPVYVETKVEAAVKAGTYTTVKDGNVTLYPAGNTSEFLYVHVFEVDAFEEGKTYTLVSKNPALVSAGLDDYETTTDGLMVKTTGTIGSDKKLGILLEGGETTVVSIYEGNVVATYENETPIAVYNFNNVAIEELAADSDEEETSEIEVTFAKELYAVESTGSLKFTYADGFEDEHGIDSLGTVKVDEDTVVYDLREEVGFAVLDFDDLKELVTTETLYVVPFVNGTLDAGAEANVLVIVE